MVYEVGLWELVRLGVTPLVTNGGRVGWLEEAPAMGGDIVGGEAVIVAIWP